jgi:diguanylate cyclase (GGDEF)-like protein
MHGITQFWHPRLTQSQHGSLLRHRVFVVCLVSLPIYLAFAANTLLSYHLPIPAAVSGLAAAFTLLSLLAVFTGRSDSLPGHLFTLALAIQVFGEMAVNGGMQAGAASISVLIVPLAFFTAGRGALWGWISATIIALVLLFFLDLQGLIPENQLPPDAQQIDRILTFVIGTLVITLLIFVFDHQINNALSSLAAERAEFRHSALHDELTGLPNRRLFYEKGQEFLHQPHENTGNLTILFIDINLFKRINDEHGHAAGDAVLVEIAKRLRKFSGEECIVARLSGDEFSVLFQDVKNKQKFKIQQEEIRQIADEPIVWNGAELKTGLSIGSAYYPDDGADFDTLLSIADKRMYWDKSSRREHSRITREMIDSQPVPNQSRSL